MTINGLAAGSWQLGAGVTTLTGSVARNGCMLVACLLACLEQVRVGLAKHIVRDRVLRTVRTVRTVHQETKLTRETACTCTCMCMESYILRKITVGLGQFRNSSGTFRNYVPEPSYVIHEYECRTCSLIPFLFLQEAHD